MSTTAPATKSKQLFERAQRVLPGGNTRLSVFFAPHPLYAVSGQGCRIVDADGVERIDCVNNMTTLIHGHSHPAIVKAVQDAAGRLMAAAAPTEVEIELAEELCARVPSVEKIRYAASGTEAVMFAIRAARAFTGRNLVAKAEGLYNGAYDPMLTGVSPSPESWGPAEAPATVRDTLGLAESAVTEVVTIPFNNVAAARAIIERHAGQLAAVVIDPLPSRLNYTEADRDYMAALREVTRKHGIMLIVDEVMSFRLGYRGAQTEWGVEADLTAFGKIIGGGLPVAAIGGRNEVMEVFNHLSGKNFVVHSGTYFGNPLSLVAGLTAIKLWDAPAIARLNGLGERFRSGMQAALRRTNVPGIVQGRGSLCHVALGASGPPLRDYRDKVGRKFDGALNSKFHRGMLDRGVFFAEGGGFILSTPMDEAVIDHIVGQAEDALRSLT
jgi:glutamate-1-semialdehyde 2,1-aminomutase